MPPSVRAFSDARLAPRRLHGRGAGSKVVARAQRTEPPSASNPAETCFTTSRRSAFLAVTGVTLASTLPADARVDGWYDMPPAGSSPKTVVITGANSGIGFAGASKLAAAGHDVHLVCRTMKKASDACDAINAMEPAIKGKVTPHECELSSLDSIRSFVDEWMRTKAPIDVLCLNAGAQFVGQSEPKRTKEGFELTVGVNHLAHFYLANLLLPAVEASKAGRIVVTASEVHDPKSAGGKVGPGADFGDLAGLKAGPKFDMVSGGPFDADKAYKDSKLCNVLFARQLADRLAAQGSTVTVNSFGPGLITRSGFFRSAPSQFIGIFDFVTNDLLGVAETVKGAGDCLAYMAVSEKLDNVSKAYFNNDTSGIPILSPNHAFTQKLPSAEAQDDAKAKELWDVSAKLVGLA